MKCDIYKCLKLIPMIFVLVSVINTEKCSINIPSIGYSMNWDFLVCSSEYREIYTENLVPNLIGEPILVNQNQNLGDLNLIFFKSKKGHIVVEEADLKTITFITNQHLICFDFVWFMILLIFILIFGFVKNRLIKVFFKIIPEFRLIIEIEYFFNFIIMILYVLYILPLFGTNPTPFKKLDPYFKECSIKDEPHFGLEFSLKGTFYLEHFISKNDWIKVNCPIDLLKNPEQVIFKVKNDSFPENLGIIHKGSSEWWEKMKYSNFIKNYDFKKLIEHQKIFEIKEEECKDKYCWWSNSNSVISQTESYYVVNSTFLPGHSGLACLKSYNDSIYYGIVQGYHHGHGYNICSKLNRGQFTLRWILFPSAPILFLIMIYMQIKYKFFRQVLLTSLTIIIITYLITLISGDLYLYKLK